MYNIVQAELFRVNEDRVFGLMLEECKARLNDGGEIKTHVRFYDESGDFTRFIQQAERLRLEKNEVTRAFPESRGIRRWWLDRKSRSLAGRSLEVGPQAARMVHRQLRAIAKKKGELAFEVNRGDKLRPVHADELHELVEAAGYVDKAWLILYGPGELLSYEPRMLGSTIGC